MDAKPQKTTFPMESSPQTNIYEIVRELGVVSHKKRQEFFVDIVSGLIKGRSVLFSEIAHHIDSQATNSSIERRIQDFFKKVNFDYLQLGVLLMSFVTHEKLLLSIDRTEWDFGKTQINILCAVVSIGKMAVPVYFEMLENNSGNSNSEDRIALLKKLISIIGKQRIDYLVMDREFIGHKWLKWLKSTGINFCVRVPKHHKITFADGDQFSAKELLADRESFYAENVIVDQTVVNLYLGYGEDGALLYLIGTAPIRELKALYRRRWAIEVFFQALKDRGFKLETSCLRNIEKYRKLFALVCIAYTICWATGIQDGKNNPVKVKKHGYPQYSVFRRGLNLIREFFKSKKKTPFLIAIKMARDKLNFYSKTLG